MIICGDSLEVLKTLEANSVDSVVTDPPYGISFMSRHWDYDVPQVELWREVYRVLKPGGHLLSFAGTRTQHRMAVNIEDAGFEIRDMIAWVYGSGFPKSLNIGKAVDKVQGNEREVIGRSRKNGPQGFVGGDIKPTITKGNSPWEGWGTALKPALEPITVARKPIEGTVANNVLKYGTGGLNIDGSRVEANSKELYRKPTEYNDISPSAGMNASKVRGSVTDDYLKGRFPANLIHDGSDEVVGLFPNTGKSNPAPRIRGKANIYAGQWQTGVPEKEMHSDSGSAARFFYCAKSSRAERNKGLEGFEEQVGAKNGSGLGRAVSLEKRVDNDGHDLIKMQNHHPTVKPVKLMQYLVKLVTPKGGTVLDPFTGSGTTGIACKLEGFEFVGIEREQEYVDIAQARIEAWEPDKQEKLI